jgi:hypothetical protein
MTQTRGENEAAAMMPSAFTVGEVLLIGLAWFSSAYVILLVMLTYGSFQ